ncbi:MAG: right-handed parallel beta-helix repeat-containing protein, partial [Planctomycetota bacterium]
MPDKYVSTTGSDTSNDGNSPGSPYLTINKALDNVNGAFTIYVANGTYTPSAKLAFHDDGVTARATNLPSGTGRGRFFGTGNLTPNVVIDGSGLGAGVDIFEIWYNDNITIDGFEMKNAPGRGLVVTGDSVTIQNCHIHDNGEYAVFGWMCNDLLITGNDIDRNNSSFSSHNMYLSDSQTNTVSYNYISRAYKEGLHINTNGMVSAGNIVKNNVFKNNQYPGNGQGGDFMNVHDSFLYNNIFVNNGWRVLSNPPDPADADDNAIFNNTFVLSNKWDAIWLFGPTSTNGTYGTAHRNIVFNNIVFTTNGSVAILDEGSNNYVSNNHTATYTSGNLTPHFVNYAAENFNLKSTSSLHKAGLSSYIGQSAPSDDIVATARPGTDGFYDLGAYEIAAPDPGPYTYYVDPSGNDTTGDGSSGTPWATIQHGMSQLAAGDTLLVNTGTYAPGGGHMTTGGTATTPIIIAANGPSVIIDGPDTSEHAWLDDCFSLGVGADYVTFDGFEIKNSLRRGIATDRANYTTVKNCVVHDHPDSGIELRRSKNCVVVSNTAYNCGTNEFEHGISIADSRDDALPDNNTVKGNLVYSNSHGIEINGYGTTGGDNTMRNSTVENNIVYQNTYGGINFLNTHDSTLQNNLCYDNSPSGGGDGAVKLGDGAAAPNNTGATNNVLANNTVVQLTYIDGLHFLASATDNYVFNNLVFGPTYDEAVNDLGGNYVDTISNLLYGNDHPAIATILANIFVDYSNGDYHINDGSLVRDGGV